MNREHRKKFYLIVAAVAVPIVLLGVYLVSQHQSVVKANSHQLNTELPKPQLKEEPQDKLGFYEKADKDSLQRAEWIRNDPYFRKDSFDSQLKRMTEVSSQQFSQPLNLHPYDASRKPEEELLNKLSVLQQQMQSPVDPSPTKQTTADEGLSRQINRLESLFELNRAETTTDPEMDQLDGTLDKILDIQHPDRVKQRRAQASHSPQTLYAVRSGNDDTLTNGFYRCEQKANDAGNSIQAVVHCTQTLINGAVIQLRLLQPVFVNGDFIPAGNFLYGTVQLEGERLVIELSSLRSGYNIYSIKMEVYDMDGLPGIFMPGAITRDAFRESGQNGLSLMDGNMMDPGLKAQATATSIGAVKNLLSKKIKLVKVQVKANYRLLLKNKNS